MYSRICLALALLAAPAVGWADAVREIQWVELIPADAPPPAPPVAYHDLSQLADVLSEETGAAATQAVPDAPVVEALDGVKVRLPGYVVPLDMNEQGSVTEFLLVPYFGACIHVPPPPSNQIVHVRTDKALQMGELWQPFWVEGPMQVEPVTSELANAGYRLQASRIYPYEL